MIPYSALFLHRFPLIMALSSTTYNALPTWRGSKSPPREAVDVRNKLEGVFALDRAYARGRYDRHRADVARAGCVAAARARTASTESDLIAARISISATRLRSRTGCIWSRK